MKTHGEFLSKKEIDKLLDGITYKPGKKASKPVNERRQKLEAKKLAESLIALLKATDNKGKKILSDKEIDILLTAIASPVDTNRRQRRKRAR